MKERKTEAQERGDVEKEKKDGNRGKQWGMREGKNTLGTT